MTDDVIQICNVKFEERRGYLGSNEIESLAAVAGQGGARTGMRIETVVVRGGQGGEH